MSKFKVGDKVKLNTDRNYTYVKEGIEYEIIKIQYLQFFNEYLFALKGIYDEVCAFSEKDFAIVSQSKFKIGDKVKVIDDTHYAYIKKEEIHEVVKSVNQKVALKGIGNELCMYDEYDFELAQRPKTMYCVTTYLPIMRVYAKNFTVDRQYKIIDENAEYYKVKDNNNTTRFAPKYFFSEKKADGEYYIANAIYNGNFSYTVSNWKTSTPKTKQQEFKELTQPISDWLYKNGSPHDSVIITQGSAEHLSGEMAVNFELKD